MVLSKTMIEDLMQTGIGINRLQCFYLGIDYPLAKGWKQKAVGKDVTLDDYWHARSAKGLTPKQVRAELKTVAPKMLRKRDRGFTK